MRPGPLRASLPFAICNTPRCHGGTMMISTMMMMVLLMTTMMLTLMMICFHLIIAHFRDI